MYKIGNLCSIAQVSYIVYFACIVFNLLNNIEMLFEILKFQKTHFIIIFRLKIYIFFYCIHVPKAAYQRNLDQNISETKGKKEPLLDTKNELSCQNPQ